MSTSWFGYLFGESDTVCLVDEVDGVVRGFVIARDYPAPPVFDPGGRNAMIDDFCVQSEDLWTTVGADLLAAVTAELKARGFVQLVVICVEKHAAKAELLRAVDLSRSLAYFSAPL